MKKLVTLTLILLTAYTQAQDEPEFGSIKVQINQDLKFMTVGDKERGYNAYTKDLLFKVKLEGRKKRNKTARSFVVLEYENADLQYGYQRFSIGYGRAFDVGFTRSFLFIPEIHWQLNPYATFGFLERGGVTATHGNIGLEHSAKLSSRLRFIATHQFTERKDLGFIYGKTEWKYSFYVGFEYQINIFQPTKTAR